MAESESLLAQSACGAMSLSDCVDAAAAAAAGLDCRDGARCLGIAGRNGTAISLIRSSSIRARHLARRAFCRYNRSASEIGSACS